MEIPDEAVEAGVAYPAVPQPVDREALTALVDGAEHYDTCFKMLTPVTNNVCTCLLADLRALLAGEQEQVESQQ
jgi:hypothetical protein